MKNLANRHIEKITPYQPGKPIEEVKRELRLKEVIKLASNENFLGPSPKALLAIRQMLKSVNRYPDGGCFYLKKKLAKKLSLTPKNIILGNGSDEVIDLIVKAFAKKGEYALTSKCTFLEYKITAQIHAMKVGEIPLKDFTYDLKAIRKAITKKVKLIFIANPNNPTGTYLTDKEIKSFLRTLPKDVIVVFDEAYKEYVGVKDFPNTIKHLNKNIVILRTFAKAYGLAGLRIGYALARPELIDAMNKVRQPFNVSKIAQAAALAALGDSKYIKKNKRLTDKGRQYLCGAFLRLGLNFIPSVCNFVLVDVNCNGSKVFGRLLKKGVIVRPMQIYGLKNFIRVTVGSMGENRKFIKALKEVL